MTVTYTTEDFVRRAVGRLLGTRRRRDGICSACLVGMTLERLHTGWRRSEIELAMGKVFTIPGALDRLPTGPCARCKRSTPCLGRSS